jgi:hypothetical protein
MTKEQIAEYLKKPDHCPCCGSDSIGALDYGFDVGQDTEPFVWSDQECRCGKKWREIYVLKTIKEIQ